MTHEEMLALLDNIRTSGGDTEFMDTAFRDLRSALDEREAMLRKYRETYDGEDAPRYRPSEYDAVVKDRDRYREDADRYRSAYLDRFSGRSVIAPPDNRQTAEFENTPDKAPLDYDALLYGRGERIEK